MQRKNDFLPLFAVLSVWLVIVGIGVALAAFNAVEPPFWDALSYAEKSKAFWDNIAAYKWINPLEIERTIRPPGVIPVSYPFGFTLAFHGFYFRWVFIPIVVLAAAAIVGGWESGKKTPFKLALLVLTLILAGMPFLYQFQPNDILYTQSNWGLVDGFLSALVAFATAAVLRSVRLRSMGWAATAAFVAAYGLFVKPAGLILMALVGVSWLLLVADSAGWNLKPLRDDRRFRWYVLGSLGIAVAIYACAVGEAFTSSYYSSQNIAFGIRNLKIFHEEVVYAIDVKLVALLLHHSAGWLVFAIIGIGVAASAFRLRHLTAAFLAVVCITGGAWFWAVTTNIGDVRYFMPFVAMAFILAMPGVLKLADAAPRCWTYGICALAAVPTLLVTIMLFMTDPPLALQRWIGVNLFTNLYQAENDQASHLLRDLDQAGGGTSQIYIFDVSSVTRNFGAVVDYHNAMDRGNVYLRTLLPVDWQRGLAFRFDEIVHSNYIAFAPIKDPAAREAILANHTIASYWEQPPLMNAWASTIGPDEGVALVSETRLRLMRVTDPAKLASALTRFATRYTWPETFRAANAPHWWAPAEAASPP